MDTVAATASGEEYQLGVGEIQVHSDKPGREMPSLNLTDAEIEALVTTTRATTAIAVAARVTAHVAYRKAGDMSRPANAPQSWC